MAVEAFPDAVLEWGWKQPHLGILIARYKNYGISILPLSKDGYDGYVEGVLKSRGLKEYAVVEAALIATVDDIILNNDGCVGVKKKPKLDVPVQTRRPFACKPNNDG